MAAEETVSGEAASGGGAGYITIHPSFLLRVPDKAQACRDFVSDLERIRKLSEGEKIAA